jgi:hypothetical protein
VDEKKAFHYPVPRAWQMKKDRKFVEPADGEGAARKTGDGDDDENAFTLLQFNLLAQGLSSGPSGMHETRYEGDCAVDDVANQAAGKPSPSSILGAGKSLLGGLGFTPPQNRGSALYAPLGAQHIASKGSAVSAHAEKRRKPHEGCFKHGDEIGTPFAHSCLDKKARNDFGNFAQDDEAGVAACAAEYFENNRAPSETAKWGEGIPVQAAELGSVLDWETRKLRLEEARNRPNIDWQDKIHRRILRGLRNISETP